jgi:hypothetical protein
VAEPEKAIFSPTFQVLLASGALIVATGGVSPGKSSTVSESLSPPVSITVSVARCLPASGYVWETVAPVASTVPSEVKSHAYVSAPSSGSKDPVPSKSTVRGVGPLVGVALATATGG